MRMPAVQYLHDKDPKEDLVAKIGDVSKVTLEHRQVLVAVYIAPEKMKSGLYRPQQNQDEDRWQGKVGLIVKTAPSAFAPDDKWSWSREYAVGDWVFFRVSDGWNLKVNGCDCRILEDVDVRGHVEHPDIIY